MWVPRQRFVDCHPQVLGVIDMLQLVAMDGVAILGGASTVGDGNNFTFFGMELHKPSFFPFLELLQVLLECDAVVLRADLLVDETIISKKAGW